MKPFKQVSTKWLMPATNRWLKKWQNIALRDNDSSTDMLRRRRGEIGHRMALMCSQLWPTFGKKEQKITRDFILWWLDVELEEGNELWRDSYNEIVNDSSYTTEKATRTDTAFDMLPKEFTVADVEEVKRKSKLNSAVKVLVSRWMKSGICEMVERGKRWRKK